MTMVLKIGRIRLRLAEFDPDSSLGSGLTMDRPILWMDRPILNPFKDFPIHTIF